MSIGTAVAFKRGTTNKSRLYVSIKNGAVYRYPRRLTEKGIQELVSAVSNAKKKVRLKHWELVRKADGTLVTLSH